LAATDFVGPLPSRFFPNNSKNVRLRGGEAYIVPDTEEHCLRRAALFNDERCAFIFDPSQKLPKIRAGP